MKKSKIRLEKVFDDPERHILQFNAFRESELEEMSDRSFYTVDSRYVQGHYVLIDEWREDELRNGKGRVNTAFGIAHTHQEAFKQAYKRISGRCKRIAKKEGLDYEYIDATSEFS